MIFRVPYHVSIAFALLLTLVPHHCGADAATNELARFEYQRPEMGMPFRMVLYAPNQGSADLAAEAAFQRIKQLNDIMSDYDADSELSKLSATSGSGRPVPVSADLWFVLARAQDLAKQSHGAFDITVGPFVNLWRRARRQHQLPDPERLAEARKAVGYEHVKLRPKGHTVELLVPNMKLDLGGIAKGYAIGEALNTLRKQHIDRALVEGGGDVAVSDPPPGKKGWRFELSSLDITNAPPERFLSLRNCAISTSGDLYQRLEINGKRYSHIVDPKTGIGLTDHSLVNIIAPDSITADSLTKVVSVLGPENGLRFVERIPHVAARVMRAPAGHLEMRESGGFSQYYDRR
ncbi:MAG TPA: FAD:protein FMN transferase [Patescibacteria group bacterium]|nr:FAD:protein FMN transferase [Patescibacteria group bacterium]